MGGVENGCLGGKRVREVGIFRVQDIYSDLWPGIFSYITDDAEGDVDSPASKAILAYPSQYLTALSSSINSYTHSWPFRNMLAGIPVRLANS